MLRLSIVFTLTVALFAGCSDFPKLDGVISPAARKADYPKLLPIDQIIAGAQDGQITEESISTLNNRIGSLRARAARLRRPVINAPTHTRLQAAIDRHT